MENHQVTTKWEYLFVLCDAHAQQWHPRFENGKELPNWEESPSIYAYSNQLGEKGWELVNVTAEPTELGSTAYRLVFKRPC